MSDKRTELVEAMDLLLEGATYRDALEALLDMTAAVIIDGAPDRAVADRVVVSASAALAERLADAWDAVRKGGGVAPGTDTIQ